MQDGSNFDATKCVKHKRKTRHTKRLLKEIEEDYERYEFDFNYERPKTRGECPKTRPCPFVSCRYHLYFDVDPIDGSLVTNFEDVPVTKMEQLEHTCALDVADEGDFPLERVGGFVNLTRERVRQLIRKLTENLQDLDDMRDFWEFDFAEVEHHASSSQMWAPESLPSRYEVAAGYRKAFDK